MNSNLVAGHPIAIRVGGRRTSVSSKGTASPANSPTDFRPVPSPSTVSPAKDDDYPRPTPATSQTSPEVTEEIPQTNDQDHQDQEENRRNRREQRKNQQQSPIHGHSEMNNKKFDTKGKSNHNAGKNVGVRINQPTGAKMI